MAPQSLVNRWPFVGQAAAYARAPTPPGQSSSSSSARGRWHAAYRAQHTGARELKGLIELCQVKRIARGYVVTKSLDDFGTTQSLPESPRGSTRGAPTAGTKIMRIPAPLLCYWMGATEVPEDAE
jgi:hypothetical protein